MATLNHCLPISSHATGCAFARLLTIKRCRTINKFLVALLKNVAFQKIRCTFMNLIITKTSNHVMKNGVSSNPFTSKNIIDCTWIIILMGILISLENSEFFQNLAEFCSQRVKDKPLNAPIPHFMPLKENSSYALPSPQSVRLFQIDFSWKILTQISGLSFSIFLHYKSPKKESCHFIDKRIDWKFVSQNSKSVKIFLSSESFFPTHHLKHAEYSSVISKSILEKWPPAIQDSRKISGSTPIQTHHVN